MRATVHGTTASQSVCGPIARRINDVTAPHQRQQQQQQQHRRRCCIAELPGLMINS